jgi:hypothetical protein
MNSICVTYLKLLKLFEVLAARFHSKQRVGLVVIESEGVLPRLRRRAPVCVFLRMSNGNAYFLRGRRRIVRDT